LLSDPGAAISWHSTGVLSASQTRPFQDNPDGINLGDGAGAIFLTANPANAQARVGRTAYSTGAKDIMAPMPEAVLQCILPILGDSAPPEEPIVINSHATGTRAGDAAEKECLSQLSCQTDRQLLCSATKAVTGHTMSASGILEAIISIETLTRQQVPMAHPLRAGEWSKPDQRPIPATFSRVYSASFGFGGMNTLLSFEKHQG
jgi:3-oxoacyl-(acyl-carrier-protein) synthase